MQTFKFPKKFVHLAPERRGRELEPKLTAKQVAWLKRKVGEQVEKAANMDNEQERKFIYTQLVQDLRSRGYHEYNVGEAVKGTKKHTPLLRVVEKYFNHLKAAGAKA